MLRLVLIAVFILLVLMLAALSMRLKLALERPLLVSAARMAVQLVLIGYVLKALFSVGHPAWVAALAAVMLAVAARDFQALRAQFADECQRLSRIA